MVAAEMMVLRKTGSSELQELAKIKEVLVEHRAGC